MSSHISVDIITSPAPALDNKSNREPTKDEQGTPAQDIFFQKLHGMICNESHTGFIEWLPSNKGFVIPCKQAFSDNILPKYFGNAKYTSFTRRLKRWGFKRISRGVDIGAYYHESFYRGMPFEDCYDEDLCFIMDRQMGRGVKNRATPSPTKIEAINSSALPLKKRKNQQFSPALIAADAVGLSPEQSKRPRLDQDGIFSVRPSSILSGHNKLSLLSQDNFHNTCANYLKEITDECNQAMHDAKCEAPQGNYAESNYYSQEVRNDYSTDNIERDMMLFCSRWTKHYGNSASIPSSFNQMEYERMRKVEKSLPYVNMDRHILFDSVKVGDCQRRIPIPDPCQPRIQPFNRAA